LCNPGEYSNALNCSKSGYLVDRGAGDFNGDVGTELALQYTQVSSVNAVTRFFTGQN